MSAVENVQPLQLGMFYKAGDLVDPSKFHHYEMAYGNTLRDPSGVTDLASLMAAKVKEAKTGRPGQSRQRVGEHQGETLYESIRDKGVKEPVELLLPAPPHFPLPMLGGGHHRVAVSAALDKGREIPVTWNE